MEKRHIIHHINMCTKKTCTVPWSTCKKNILQYINKYMQNIHILYTISISVWKNMYYTLFRHESFQFFNWFPFFFVFWDHFYIEQNAPKCSKWVYLNHDFPGGTPLQDIFSFYPSALRAGGVLSSRSGRTGGRAGGRAGGCQTCGTHISVTAWWIFSVRSSMELSRPVVVHCHAHLPICPIWACPWAKNLSNLSQIGSRLCGSHISETAGWIYPI